MKIIATMGIRNDAAAGLDFIEKFLQEQDTSRLNWVRFDYGSIRNGTEGRCLMPAGGLGYRIACQFPKAFPLSIRISLPPIYRGSDGSWPPGIDPKPHEVITNEKTGKQWIRQNDIKEIEDQNEAAVWTFFNASYHWLRHSKQIEGRDNEIEADAFSEKMLRKFHRNSKVLI